MSDDRRNLIVGNLPEETVAALQDARMPNDAMSDAMSDDAAKTDTIVRLRDEVERLRRCVSMAMGCLDPLSIEPDERLAWHRLKDALDGKEPREGLMP